MTEIMDFAEAQQYLAHQETGTMIVYGEGSHMVWRKTADSRWECMALGRRGDLLEEASIAKSISTIYNWDDAEAHWAIL